MSKSYYYEILEPRIHSDCPQCLERIAVGLFGPGSQCLGFGDEISRDHDWGLRVCILLNDEDYRNLSADLERVLKESPQSYQGLKTSWEWMGPRGGVLNTKKWFDSLLDEKGIPKSPVDWLSIAEHCLLLATNGEIWHDALGEVTELRRYLSYYPEEVWKKRVAFKCAAIGQSGGNVERTVQRRDNVTASIALHHFIKEVMQIWFLLNRTYAPFYKRLFRAFTQLNEVPDGLV